MEEILSSIRRIIADEEADEDKPGERRPDLAASDADDQDHDDEDEDDEDVLELTKVVRDGGEVVDLKAERGPVEDEDEPEPAVVADEAEAATGPDIEMTQLEPEPAPETAEPVARKETPPVPPSPVTSQNLVSEGAATAATGSFARLSHAFQRTPEEVSIADGSGRSVEQFIEDMLRPMLKEWLDENMPPLVERLVEKEIQKLARRSELI